MQKLRALLQEISTLPSKQRAVALLKLQGIIKKMPQEEKLEAENILELWHDKRNPISKLIQNSSEKHRLEEFRKKFLPKGISKQRAALYDVIDKALMQNRKERKPLSKTAVIRNLVRVNTIVKNENPERLRKAHDKYRKTNPSKKVSTSRK